MITDSEANELKKILFDFIDRKCIFRCDPNIQYHSDLPPGKIPGKNPGYKTSWQFYLRNLIHDSDMMSAASMLFLKQIEKNNDYGKFQFAGLETGSLPLIASYQSAMRKLGISINSYGVRKERKAYGLFNFVDGIPDRTLPVCVVDDIFNSGSSLNRVLDVSLFEFDINPHINMYCLVQIGNKPFSIFNGYMIKINSLFKSSEFNFEYDKDKYWHPFDSDKSFNKRPDYF